MSKPSNNEKVGFDVTLQVKNACLCLHVQRAARSLARLFDEAFRPVGITNGQFSMLMSLNRPGPARMREVAALLAMDRTTLTAALKTLERRGLLEVRTDPDDRRGRLLTLTDAGRDTLARAVPIWRDTHAALEQGLDDADRLRAALLAIS
ncbi:MarR family transcriptional regulator [Aquibium sp. ELW1220]|jgi:DNA-binding MarR family transcriptional regulator|uniref:MarR family winged helix-turn-helix transcriptional regulator n=1 Tax=Aquibium sp. ELW1220 TaxID=2976766 RepID=UPI0025B1F681|nr:MarR family transcriptional regulator [Aquibium sp. ELW1220]MDN2580415.1 MarR family transcriptional regulator [Aquibium sp. ELW1220]